MNKKQIIDKIIDDLPTRDIRGEMSPDEWYWWFEEAFDKGYNEALRNMKKLPCKHRHIESSDGCDECLDCGIRNY
jgi:hypothetical protein